MKVLAAVVTHNRCALLSRCIDGIEAQTRVAHDIVVIDNACTDGTVQMLQRRGVRFITQENVGSAGGWHRSIKYALDNGYDAVWLMDDDGYPDAHALGSLVSALHDGLSCVSSIVVREDEPSRFVFPFPVLNAKRMPVIFGWPRRYRTLVELAAVSPGGTYAFAHLFNGALISLRAVRTVGNVNTDYFIYGDEVDYFFRLRQFGPVISVLDAVHYHPDVSQRSYSPMKVYYYVKNSLVLNARYFNIPWIRHVLLLGIVLVRMTARSGLAFSASLVAGRNAPIFYRAILRGLRGKIGKDFDV
ncbi:MAG: glycosyltransferase [Casimicrobium sp.]